MGKFRSIKSFLTIFISFLKRNFRDLQKLTKKIQSRDKTCRTTLAKFAYKMKREWNRQ